MNNNEFKLEGFASWDLPVYLHRQNPVPLDETSVFTSFEAAQQYASDEQRMAYPGQIISVVTDSFLLKRISVLLFIFASSLNCFCVIPLFFNLTKSFA